MKNKIKKILSVFAALVLMIGLSSSVKADNVTVDWGNNAGNSSRTLVAYQIFTGTLEKVTNPETGQLVDTSTLGDIEWGTAAENDQIKLALIKAVGLSEEGASLPTAADVAEKIVDENAEKVAKDLSATISRINEAAEKEEKPEDKIQGRELNLNGSTDLATGYYVIIDETKSLADGEMYNPTVLQVVGATVIKPKTIAIDYGKTVQDGVNGEPEGTYGDSADYSIGDSVPFRLYAQIPSKSTLDHYDEYFLEITDTASSGLTLPEANEVKVYYAEDNEKKGEHTLLESTEYTALVNKEKNTLTITFDDITKQLPNADGGYIVVEYNALLNENAAFRNDNKVHIQYSNKPNDSSSKHTTGDDTVYVYCFTIKGTKVGEDEKRLKDAEFIISRGTGASEKYLSIDDEGKVTWSPTRPTDGNIKSDNDGNFTINGLDAGEYNLYEVKAPAGYNTPSDPFTVKITAEHKGNEILTSDPNEFTVKVDGDEETKVYGNPVDGTLAIKIANTKGSTLPETGGMGTTILYIAGAILLIGSGVMLVTKRRMKTN